MNIDLIENLRLLLACSKYLVQYLLLILLIIISSLNDVFNNILNVLAPILVNFFEGSQRVGSSGNKAITSIIFDALTIAPSIGTLSISPPSTQLSPSFWTGSIRTGTDAEAQIQSSISA